MPSGRVLPSPLGISTRLTACGRYVSSRSAASSSDRYTSACAANRSIDCPSTPAAPRLARTRAQAARSVADAYTLSINENHLPPLTPLTRADSMRSVHTEASTHGRVPLAVEVSAPCLASALPVLLCSDADKTASTFLPCLPSNGFCCPVLSRSSHRCRSGTMRALTPRRLAHAAEVSLLPLPCRPSIPPPTTPWARSITISSTSV